MSLAKFTLPVRHFIVQCIAPKVYYYAQDLPRYSTQYMQSSRYFSNRKLKGAEIGVFKGENSRNMLTLLNIEKLYLIDPYSPYIEYEENKAVPKDYANIKPIAKKNLRHWKDKCVFIYETSNNAVELIPDNLDFIYIDANHSYQTVKQDIENYFPKLHNKGLIGGHDFCGSYISVAKAVLEFAKEHKRKVFGKWHDWIILKDCYQS